MSGVDACSIAFMHKRVSVCCVCVFISKGIFLRRVSIYDVYVNAAYSFFFGTLRDKNIT